MDLRSQYAKRLPSFNERAFHYLPRNQWASFIILNVALVPTVLSLKIRFRRKDFTIFFFSFNFKS
jgi:hypothetical protein